MQAALSAAGIRPSNSQRYPVQDIKDAIENMYGVMPHVTCDAKGALSEVGGGRPCAQRQAGSQGDAAHATMAGITAGFPAQLS